MGRYIDEEDMKKIMRGMSKKTFQSIINPDNSVGHVMWQMTLHRDYLKLDGSQLADASKDYYDLYEWVINNNLTTTDVDNLALFQYDSENDILTLPNWMDKTVWGGNSVEEKEAGLPNTDGTLNAIQLIPQIKYKKSSTVWETVEIGRFVSTAPSHYERESLFDTDKTTTTLKPTWINIDGGGYVLQENKIINIEDANYWDDAQYTVAANRAGKDFYIYACKPVSNVAPDFILSANSTVPTGYTANDSRKIGGFHCLCLDVGTIDGHTLSGYLTGDILPATPWDLIHRAESENEGMAFVKPIGLWADIYDGSWNGSNLVSAYNQVCVTGESAKKMHGIMMAEEYGLVSKFLPSYDEFIVAAKGTPESDHISTGAVPTGAGGHVGTLGKRIISNYGLEDCVGVLWQWSRDLAEDYHQVYNSATAYRGSYYATANDYWLSGYAWVDNPVYNPTVDTVKRGSCSGLLRRLILGGGYGDAVAFCGSRAVFAYDFGARLHAYFGGRGFSRKR